MLPLDESGSIGQPLILRQDIIETILQIIYSAWVYVCKRPDIDAECDEPTIAGALHNEMWAEKKRRKIPGPPQIINESAERYSEKSLKPDGFIDFKIIYGWNKQDYFGIECKRVSCATKGKNRDLATKYVTEGMIRFVEGKYSPGHDYAAMLGFVIDNQPQKCIDRICKRIDDRKKEICLEEYWKTEDNFNSQQDLYRTSHHQKSHNSLINILHLFLEIS